MHIRTYQNPVISTFQSALRDVLAESGADITNLGADHPLMQAACDACDEVMPSDHVHEVADKVEKSDLMRECGRLYVRLLQAKMMGNRKRVAELEDEIRFSVCDPMWAKVLLEYRKGEDAKIPYRHYEWLDDFVEPLPDGDTPVSYTHLTLPTTPYV